jgi:multidrug efflux pump subunit AcrA (membrane-fusion protein)
VAALAAARDLARTKLKRMHALAQLDRGGRLELETAAAEFEIADHRLQQAREALSIAQREEDMSRAQLEQRRIRSPIDGVVADRLLNPGERVDGRPIFRLVTLNRLRVEVVVPAKRFGEIKEGAMATVTPEGIDAPEVTAKVVQVDRFVDAASGTFRARLSLPNPAGQVPPGARCRIAFAAPAETPAAPSSAAKEPVVSRAPSAGAMPVAAPASERRAKPHPAPSARAPAPLLVNRRLAAGAPVLPVMPGIARVIERSLQPELPPASLATLEGLTSEAHPLGRP